ncbi:MULTISPECIES: hypothetical protein [Pseudomonas chlororaphis group]|uniref:hypothetical protein n=1 Tax=Pseudomonas chlororaphis group TaxID=136842 RepID=UPI00209776E9|nr:MULTISPECIES: hypothetical protein [Pseudomonas chlororaphis group]MCO7576207.1 hypothetical protein [Pseudomonas protegens]MCO7580955.1 hypothetical protein [Pseudomonas chlororaphis]MCO7598020.1 hypothetical protein [Pseudomonas chlororaphis]
MNSAQKLLIERSLRRLGLCLIAIFIGLMTWGMIRLAINQRFTFERFMDGIFSVEDAALIVWPPLLIGVLSVWLSAFMKAGRSD